MFRRLGLRARVFVFLFDFFPAWSLEGRDASNVSKAFNICGSSMERFSFLWFWYARVSLLHHLVAPIKSKHLDRFGSLLCSATDTDLVAVKFRAARSFKQRLFMCAYIYSVINTYMHTYTYVYTGKLEPTEGWSTFLGHVHVYIRTHMGTSMDTYIHKRMHASMHTEEI